jgi:predicted aldo/keto reductase-like oxidoreductase
MSLILFVALCVLAVDFLIYVLLQWTYGDKRQAMAKKLAAMREAEKKSMRPFVVEARSGGAITQARLQKVRQRMGHMRERRLA